MGAIATPCVTLDQLVGNCTHNVAILAHNVTELISDVSVGVGLVMHGKADIHGTIQVGRGLGFAQSGAGDFVSHADIIGTGFGDLGSVVDALLTVTISLCFQSLKWGHVINNCLSTSELRCNNLALRFQLFVFSLLGNQCVIH